MPPKGKQEVARYGLYKKPHKGFANRTWYFSKVARDAEYNRSKAKAGPDKTKFEYAYVKKVQR